MHKIFALHCKGNLWKEIDMTDRGKRKAKEKRRKNSE